MIWCVGIKISRIIRHTKGSNYCKLQRAIQIAKSTRLILYAVLRKKELISKNSNARTISITPIKSPHYHYELGKEL